MKYHPDPLDTSEVKLTVPVQELIEKIARNIHEVWASRRMAEGWQWGNVRDDATRRHPCLIPYDELPESEREYDRATVTETLKSVIALGFHIEPPAAVEKPFQEANLSLIAKQLSSPEPVHLNDLQKIWETHSPEQWAAYPELYRLLAERIIRIGEPLLAYDVLSSGLQNFSGKDLNFSNDALWIRLRQMLGLSLAQSGATARAQHILRELYDQGLRDGETLGILGRTYKDLAMGETNPETRIYWLGKAFDCYFEAYAVSQKNENKDDAYYTGINAATLALLRGDGSQARRIAHQVLTICRACSRDISPETTISSYWRDASSAEAYLILGDIEAAVHCYNTAVQKAQNNFRDISAMKRQAALIADHAHLETAHLERCFPLPQIGIFVPQNAGSGNSETAIDEAIIFPERLKKLNIGIAYVSVTSFTDILFAEAVLSLRDTELHVVLPFSIEEIRHLFETTRGNDNLLQRFEFIMQKATKLYELSYICALGNEQNYEFSTAFTTGMATLRGRWLNTHVHYLDDQCLKNAECGTSFHRNDCSTIHYQEQPVDFPDTASRHIYAMMFADVKNYSRLNENQLLLFAHHFMDHTARMIQPFSQSLIFKRTTGDGFFFVFNNLSDALDFALVFRKHVTEMNWPDFGLPDSLTVRISLDAGPIFSYHDKVADSTDVCGKYVIRAARMEPITPPGEIYASESFAALAASRGVDQAEFAYAGRIRLPKDFGIIPVYHVRPLNS